MNQIINIVFVFLSNSLDEIILASGKNTNVPIKNKISVRSGANKTMESDIAADYYFGKEGLRTDLQTAKNFDICKTDVFQLWCQIQCKSDNLCTNGECYCLRSPVGSNGKSLFITKADSLELAPYFEDDDEEEIDTKPVLYPEVNTKLALRHQIAHFCPNLNIARECITKCMEQGKPAFCGKDHRCYCGHRDVHTLNAGKKLDAYKQYHDMYKKYLGLDGSHFARV